MFFGIIPSYIISSVLSCVNETNRKQVRKSKMNKFFDVMCAFLPMKIHHTVDFRLFSYVLKFLDIPLIFTVIYFNRNFWVYVVNFVHN